MCLFVFCTGIHERLETTLTHNGILMWMNAGNFIFMKYIFCIVLCRHKENSCHGILGENLMPVNLLRACINS